MKWARWVYSIGNDENMAWCSHYDIDSFPVGSVAVGAEVSGLDDGETLG